MSDVLNAFNDKFKTDDLKLYESTHWIWSLRPAQVTLGSGILSLKRECAAFSELEREEYADLQEIIPVIENTLKQTFDYDIMNYLMLMMLDKHVHYHVIPRYEDKIDEVGQIWHDKGWPGVPDLSGDVNRAEILKEIRERIIKNLVTN